VYDKYRMIDKYSIFSHLVFGKISACVEATLVMYMWEGKVLNRRFNHYSQQVLLSFPLDVHNIGMEEQLKLAWLDIKKIVCAVKNGRFYSGKHSLNVYCFEFITTKVEGIRERTIFYYAVNKKVMITPRVWAHTIEYLVETKDSGKLLNK
jgi:hypothetical protein